MYPSIREEHVVTETLRRAGNVYPRVWDAFESLCWVLVHRQVSGASFQGVVDIYHLHKQDAGGYGVPALTVLYTASETLISLHALKVG